MGNQLAIPKVSVVMATYNRPRLLSRAIESICGQTFQDWELIIVDNGSNPETGEMIASYQAKDGRILSVRIEPNQGCFRARNVGIKAARAEYVAIMDDDDESLPERLSRQYEIFKKDPEMTLVFSSTAWVNDKGEIYKIFPTVLSDGFFPKKPSDVFRFLYLEGSKIPDPTVMVRKAELDKEQPYDEKYGIAADWKLFMTLAAKGKKMFGISQPTVRVNRGDAHTRLTKDKTKMYDEVRACTEDIYKTLESNNGKSITKGLFRKAMARRYSIEALYYRRWKGVTLVIQGMLYDVFDVRLWISLLRILKFI